MTRSTRSIAPAEVVRLHVDHGDAVELGDLRRRDDLDVDVEQVHHPQVLGPGHALQGADDRRLPGAVQHVCAAPGRWPWRRGPGRCAAGSATRSASLKKRWYCWTRSRVSERLNSVSSGPPKSSDSDEVVQLRELAP